MPRLFVCFAWLHLFLYVSCIYTSSVGGNGFVEAHFVERGLYTCKIAHICATVYSFFRHTYVEFVYIYVVNYRCYDVILQTVSGNRKLIVDVKNTTYVMCVIRGIRILDLCPCRIQVISIIWNQLRVQIQTNSQLIYIPPG